MCLLGEISVDDKEAHFEQVARRVAKEIGFTSEEKGLDADNMNVILNVQK